MHYGHQSFFRERRLAHRRVALNTLALHAFVLFLMALTQIPAVRTFIRPATRPIVRFGYEGPDRYVERILLATQSRPQQPLLDIGKVQAMPSRTGGGGLAPARD